MTQTDQTSEIGITATDNPSRFQQFLSKYSVYLQGEAYSVGSNKAINVKPNVITDPDKVKELKEAAKEFGGALSLFPSPPKFLFPSFVVTVPKGFILRYLMPEDIEGGGPQPRGEIDPQDPETIDLHLDIKKEGQLVPIQTYASPAKNGRCRIYEGHRRHMVIFTMLQGKCPSGPGIWALEASITEQQAFEYAFKINYKRKNLSAYELGAYMMELPKKFPDTYKLNAHGFSFQETLGKQLGLDQANISRALSAYRDVAGQSGQLPPDIYARCIKLEGRVVDEIKKAPPETKSVIYETVVEKKLQSPVVKELVKLTKENPTLTKPQIEVEAERIQQERTMPKPEPIPEPPTPIPKTEEEIAQERVEQLSKQDEKYEKKLDRQCQKLIDAASGYPENLMRAIFGHYSQLNKKIETDDAKDLAGTAMSLIYDWAVEHGLDIDEIIQQSKGWL